jgi:MFS family permease
MTFYSKSKVLRRFAIAHFALECQFWFPVWLIFLTQKGFDLTTIVLADGVFRLTAVVMEFPMGFISDRLGRKNTYISICILSIITYAGIIFINGQLMLFSVWVIWGILWALYSGVPSSYIYELIIKEKLESQTIHILGIFKMISSSALLFSYLGAGFLMSLHQGLPFVANILMVVLALIFIMPLPGAGDDRITLQEHKDPFSTLRLFKKSRNGSEILILVSLMAMTLIFFWSPRILMQPLFIELQLSAIEVGLVYFSYSLAGIIAGILVNRIGEILGYKKRSVSLPSAKPE